MICYLLIILDSTFMHALLAICMHVCGAFMHLFNGIFIHRVIAAFMVILHAMSWQLTMNHIAAPQDSHARQPLHVTLHIHGYTKCSIHAYIECCVNARIRCYTMTYIGGHIDAYVVCYMNAYISNCIQAMIMMYWMQCSWI